MVAGHHRALTALPAQRNNMGWCLAFEVGGCVVVVVCWLATAVVCSTHKSVGRLPGFFLPAMTQKWEHVLCGNMRCCPHAACGLVSGWSRIAEAEPVKGGDPEQGGTRSIHKGAGWPCWL